MMFNRMTDCKNTTNDEYKKTAEIVESEIDLDKVYEIESEMVSKQLEEESSGKYRLLYNKF